MKRAEKLILARQKKLEDNIENEFSGMCYWLHKQKSINQYEAQILLDFMKHHNDILNNAFMSTESSIDTLNMIVIEKKTYYNTGEEPTLAINIGLDLDTGKFYSNTASSSDIAFLFSDIEDRARYIDYGINSFIGMLRIIYSNKETGNIVHKLLKLYNSFQMMQDSYPTHILYNLIKDYKNKIPKTPENIITNNENNTSKKTSSNIFTKIVNLFSNFKKTDKTVNPNRIKAYQIPNFSSTLAKNNIEDDNIDNIELIYQNVENLLNYNFPKDDGLSFVHTLPLDNPVPDIQIKKKIFYLTGDFINDKYYCMEEIELQGGKITRRMENTVNYLLVGSLGFLDWDETPTGKRIKKVLSMKEKGVNIAIISEDDFLKKALSFNPIVK